MTTVVTVDVVLAVAETPPPIAVTGPTPAPGLARLLQPHVRTAETGVGMKAVGRQANLNPTRIHVIGAESCLTMTGGDDIMLWQASPCAIYLV